MSDKPNFRLRPLEEKDLETVAVFEGEIAKMSFPDDPITDTRFYVKKLKQLMANKDAATFVAESEGEPVGWANVSQRQNFITKEKYADFHSIYVAPSQRGGGVVSALVNAVFDHCRKQGLDKVVFRTRANNERMKSVLARVGFVPTQIYYEKALDSKAKSGE
ncbi:MAG: GNAT family N-acetyltransferase [Bradyrhizobium sp.]